MDKSDIVSGKIFIVMRVLFVVIRYAITNPSMNMS